MPDNKDTYNEITLATIAVVIVFFVLTAMVVFILLFYQKRKFQHAKKLIELEQQKKQELLQTQLEIQEQTFQNISQELHDNVGQVLSVIKLTINTVNLNDTETTKDQLIESKNLLTKVIQDLRDLSKTLNTDYINEIGLPAAIEQQLLLLQKTALYKTELIVNGVDEKYQLQRELVVFRVIQELLNNIVKHANASTISIVMNYENEKLLITVSDDGKGFNTKENKTGLGLRNMQHRINLINGSVTIISNPNDGTVALIELPKQTNQHGNL